MSGVRLGWIQSPWHPLAVLSACQSFRGSLSPGALGQAGRLGNPLGSLRILGRAAVGGWPSGLGFPGAYPFKGDSQLLPEPQAPREQC